MKNSIFKILIAGEGGQGVQAMGQILNMAAIDQGLESVYIPNYGVEQRGGVSLAFIQISDSPIPYPKFKIADVLVVMCARAIKRVKDYYDSKTKIINGIGFIEKPSEYNLSPKTHNILILGILSEFLPLEKTLIIKAMEKRFKGAPAQLIAQNKQAFLIGRGLGLKLPDYAKKLNPISVSDHRNWPADVKQSKTKPKITHIIHRKLCKSCGICIYRCPTGALHFSSKLTGIYGTPIVEVDIEKCIGCRLCETVCPDTAIEVKREK